MPDKEMMDLLRQSKELIERLNSELEISRGDRIALRAKIEDMTPTAEFGEAVIADERFYTMKEVADISKERLLEDKKVTIGRNKLFAMLRDMGILSDYKSNWNAPYRKFIDSGLFHVKVKETPVGMMSVTMVTGKGLEYIQAKVAEYVDEMGL
jgi:anti-repressor protein